MFSRHLIHARVDCKDYPEHKLSAKESHHYPKARIHGLHVALGLFKFTLDRLSVIPLQVIHASVHKVQLLNKAQVEIGLICR